MKTYERLGGKKGFINWTVENNNLFWIVRSKAKICFYVAQVVQHSFLHVLICIHVSLMTAESWCGTMLASTAL